MRSAAILSWCYPRIVSLPCPKGADRRGAVGKTDEESGEVRGTCGESVSPSPRMTKISRFARNDRARESDVS